MELHAFNYWIANFTGWQNHLHDVGHEYGSYALCHHELTQPDSSIQLALTAFTLAVFGQAKHLNEALEIADTFYAKSIAKMRREIRELSCDTIDRLIVATALMGSFDVCFDLTAPD